MRKNKIVFVPFLGDLFSMKELYAVLRYRINLFSSPFSGTFFQSDGKEIRTS